LPLLYRGLESNEVTVFVGLLGLHLLALVVGHNYNSD
jgi:hypothetical protein